MPLFIFEVENFSCAELKNGPIGLTTMNTDKSADLMLSMEGG